MARSLRGGRVRPVAQKAKKVVLQTQAQLAPAYAPNSSAPTSTARTRAGSDDHSAWLFALAPLSFALTLACVIYLSLISY